MSNSSGTENDYNFQLGLGNAAGFRQDIANKLGSLGSALSPNDIARRATTQSCGGCHQLSNNVLLGGLDAAGNPLRWPASAGLVHTVENGARSPALNTVFLPKRKSILEQFLTDTCTTVCSATTVLRTAEPAGLAASGDEPMMTITGKATVH